MILRMTTIIGGEYMFLKRGYYNISFSDSQNKLDNKNKVISNE